MGIWGLLLSVGELFLSLVIEQPLPFSFSTLRLLMTSASLLQTYSSSLWSLSSLTLGWMICVLFSCSVNAVRTKKHHAKRSLQVETRTSFSWHLSSKKRVYCKFMQIPNVFSEIPTFGNPMLERYVWSIYPKLSPGLLLASWTKCGTSDVKLEIQRSEDRGIGDSLDFQRIQNRELKFIFIPNLYQLNPIYTTLLPTSFSRKTWSRREKPWHVCIWPIYPANASLQYPSPRFSTARLSKTSLQHHSALLYTTSNTFLRHSSTTVLYNALRK